MTDDDYGYRPKAPVVRPPTAPSGVESELRHLNRARSIRNPVASVVHRVGERASRKALEATERRFDALKTATDSCNAAVESMGVLGDTVLRLQARRELAQLGHEFALEAEVMRLNTEFNRGKEALHTAQRAAITAQNGAEAAVRFKEANFRIGQTRKDAQIAETADLVEPAKSNPTDRVETIDNLFRLRSELRADGKDTANIDDAINELGGRLGIAAE